MESKLTSTRSFGQLHAQVQGKGVAVILIHGFSPEVNSWRTWIKNMDPLASRFRVYALDLIGYGESDKPESRLDDQEQAQAVGEWMDAEGIGTTVLVGLSWGGMVAQNVALARPERVVKLVLVDSAYDSSEAGLKRLAAIRCPTLIVWDAEDSVLPVENARPLSEAIPGSQLHIFQPEEREPDADPKLRHWSQVSHAGIWNRVVLEFISREQEERELR